MYIAIDNARNMMCRRIFSDIGRPFSDANDIARRKEGKEKL
jgi:hypothetical protein